LKIPNWPKQYWNAFSSIGLLVATLCFAASLSPSLLPRAYYVQGILSGFALAVGYSLGVVISWVWEYFELPELLNKYKIVISRTLGFSATSIACIFLWRATTWQNSIRDLMGMEPLTSTHPWKVGIIAIFLAAVLIAGSRVIHRSYRLVAVKLNKIVPPRISAVVSVIVVVTILFGILDEILIKETLKSADKAFLQWDELVEDDIAQPINSIATGSVESLVAWNHIGRRGKHFIVTGPTKKQLSQFLGQQAYRPLRVYVGLGSKDSAEERVKLALNELKRADAFSRSILVIATPTGTGWIDPGAVDTLEYLHAGDSAIVSMQYSYLPSWLTLLLDPDHSRDAARILFEEIYGYWTTLPKENRPKLYLHGLSLGALGSEASTQLFLVLEDLFNGAVWSGPPFPSTIWSRVTADRDPDTPAWLPQFHDGSMIRFTNRENTLEIPGARWGPMRIVYIQHASDPMSFFSPNILFRKPDWLNGKRGPDVSPYFSWYPIITFLQLVFDLPMATSVPSGYGHNISPASYIDAWVEVTQPKGWDAENIQRLKRLFDKAK
jgi:uncharacterized membrane protein